jgi:putative ABC transport system permease protein
VLGFKNPLGPDYSGRSDERWKIVGVVKDFLVGDPNQASEPVLIKGRSKAGQYISMRISGSRPFVENARQAEAILKKYNPNYITALQFADLDYAVQIPGSPKYGVMLINTFTFIAIFVSCMGLLGLATYMAENRTREIGIRKVLGSGVTASFLYWPGTLSG